MPQQTLQNIVTFRRAQRIVGAGLFVVLIAVFSLLPLLQKQVTAATSDTINFQARLLQSNGSLVPDGYYNVEFKVYNTDAGGTALWTETYYDANGATAGSDNRLRVVNGYLSANLGSQTAFGGSINWDQEHWITMNIGGTSQVASPTWDGEMDPRLKLTAVPYAFAAGQLNKTTGGLTSTLGWANQTAANTISLPDAAGTICLQNNAACGFVAGTASDYIQNGTSPQTAYFNITGDGTIGGTLNVTGTGTSVINDDLKIGTSANNYVLLQNGNGGRGTASNVVISSGDGGGNRAAFYVKGGAAGNTFETGGTSVTNTKITTSANNIGLMIQGASSQSANLLTFADSTGATLASFGAGGDLAVQNVTVGAGKSIAITGGITSTRPVAPANGTIYFDTTTQQLLTYSNGKWQADRSTATKIVAASNSSQAAKDAADFVADGDTATAADGDQVQINQAINAVGSNGGKVYLMEGTYTIDASILLMSNITLTGAGNGTIVKAPDAFNADLSIIANSDTTNGNFNITINNIKIDGNRAAQASGSTRGIDFIKVGSGTGTTAVPGARITNVTITGARGRSIGLDNSLNNSISNNYLIDGFSEGILLTNGSTNNAITGNTIQNQGRGLDIRLSSHENNITGNLFEANRGDAVSLSNSSRNVFSGNTFVRNSENAIDLSVSFENLINGNIIRDNGGTGTFSAINFGSNSDRNMISNNTISDTSGTGHAIEITTSTSEENVLSNNIISGTGASTISDSGTNTIYSNQLNGSGVLMNRSSGGFTVQNTSGQGVITADPTAGEVVLGQSSALNGQLSFANSTNGNTVSIVTGVTSTSYTLTLPTALGASGSCLADTTGTGVLGFTTCGGAGGDGGVLTVGGIDTQTKSANGSVIDGTAIYLQTADADYAGLVSTGTQTFAGAKTFNDTVSIAAGKGLVLNGGLTGTRPVAPDPGTIYFDTTTQQLLTYANGKWQAASRESTKIVAPSTASQAMKDAADFVADGTADEVQINDALTATTGGKVYLMEGTFTVSASISVPNNTTLQGAGDGTEIQLADLDAAAKMIVNTDTSTGTGVAIRDLKLNGRKDLNTAGTQDGVYFNGMGGGSGATARQGGRLMNVVVVNMRSYGFYLSSAYNNTLTGNTAQGNGSNGFHFTTASNNTLTSNTARGNGGNGFHISAASNNTITGNTAQGNSGSSSGFYLSSASNNNTLTGNTAQGNGTSGFLLTDSANNTFTGNTAQGNGSNGFYLSSASNNNTLTGNTAQGNGTRGFYLSSSDSNTITGNRLIDTGGASNNNAIYLETSDSNSITGNVMSDAAATTNFAINISNNTSDINYVSDNTLGGGSINDAGTGTIYANQIDENGVLVNRASGGFAVQSTAGTDIFNVDSSTSAIAVDGTMDVQANNANAFAVKNNSTDILFNVDTSNNQVALGNVGGAPTLFVLGAKTTDGDPATGTNGAMYYNSFMNEFRCYINGAWAGCGGSGGGGGGASRMVVLIPEFAGGTLQADGSNNAGVMNADFVGSLSSGEGYKHNYYQWTSSNTAAQDYNIIVNTPVPTDYVSGFTDFKIWTYASSTTLAGATIQLQDQDGTACYASAVSITPTTASTWQQISVGATTGCVFSANDIITITIVVSAEDNEVVRIGEVSFGYTN